MNTKQHTSAGTESIYAVMGITGQVGGAVARALLEKGQRVRGIVRDKAKAAQWERQGVELAVANSDDAAALKAAFHGVDGAFVMLPPYFAPAAGFPEARAVVGALAEALAAAAPAKVVALSSIGGQHAERIGILEQLYILEEGLGRLPMPLAFVRPGWFMENSAWDVEPAKKTGMISSFLQPPDRAFPLVATQDIGLLIAGLLMETWTGRRIVEIEGPRRYSPRDIAEAFSSALGREVSAVAVPRDSWISLFQAQGAVDPSLRIEMLDGFNSGWVEFEGGAAEHVTGETGLETVIRELAGK